MKNIFNTFLLIILGMIINLSKGDIVLKQESNHEFLSSYYDDKNPNSLTNISDEYLKVKENEKYTCYIFLELETRIFFKKSYYDSVKKRTIDFDIIFNTEKIEKDNYIYFEENDVRKALDYFEKENLYFYNIQYGRVGEKHIYKFGFSTYGQGTLSGTKDLIIINENHNFKVYILDKYFSGPLTYGDYNNNGKFDIVTSINYSKVEKLIDGNVSRVFYGTSYLIDFKNVWESEYVIDSLDHISCNQWGGQMEIL